MKKAEKTFKNLWKNRNEQTGFRTTVRLEQVKMLLEDSQLIIHYLIQGLKLFPRHMVSTPQKQDALKHYFKVLKITAKALQTMSYFDIMKSLYYSLELFEGTLAHSQGPSAYKKFQLKYHSPQYESLV